MQLSSCVELREVKRLEKKEVEFKSRDAPKPVLHPRCHQNTQM